jgi:hypothetical protein
MVLRLGTDPDVPPAAVLSPGGAAAGEAVDITTDFFVTQCATECFHYYNIKFINSVSVNNLYVRHVLMLTIHTANDANIRWYRPGCTTGGRARWRLHWVPKHCCSCTRGAKVNDAWEPRKRYMMSRTGTDLDVPPAAVCSLEARRKGKLSGSRSPSANEKLPCLFRCEVEVEVGPAELEFTFEVEVLELDLAVGAAMRALWFAAGAAAAPRRRRQAVWRWWRRRRR